MTSRGIYSWRVNATAAIAVLLCNIDISPYVLNLFIYSFGFTGDDANTVGQKMRFSETGSYLNINSSFLY